MTARQSYKHSLEGIEFEITNKYIKIPYFSTPNGRSRYFLYPRSILSKFYSIGITADELIELLISAAEIEFKFTTKHLDTLFILFNEYHVSFVHFLNFFKNAEIQDIKYILDNHPDLAFMHYQEVC